MQRANGDWFALDDHGAFRITVTAKYRDAKGPVIEMLVFRPVELDETSLKDLARVNPTGPSHFWLVDAATVNLKRGHRVEHAELSRFTREPGGNNGNA